MSKSYFFPNQNNDYFANTPIAAEKTSGTVLFTKNKWDIAPGILLCQEAGAIVKGLNCEYSKNSNVVIMASSEELYYTIVNGILNNN